MAFWKAKGHVLQDGPAGRMPRRAVVGLHAGLLAPLIRISGVVISLLLALYRACFRLIFRRHKGLCQEETGGNMPIEHGKTAGAWMHTTDKAG